MAPSAARLRGDQGRHQHGRLKTGSPDPDRAASAAACLAAGGSAGARRLGGACLLEVGLVAGVDGDVQLRARHERLHLPRDHDSLTIRCGSRRGRMNGGRRKIRFATFVVMGSLSERAEGGGRGRGATCAGNWALVTRKEEMPSVWSIPARGTRRVQLVRGEGRGVSN